MATVNFTLTKYAKSKGHGAATLRSSKVTASGQDIITGEEDLQDASGVVNAPAGAIFSVHSDGALRIAFGGDTATGTTGHFIPAELLMDIEVEDDGPISVIEAG